MTIEERWLEEIIDERKKQDYVEIGHNCILTE